MLPMKLRCCRLTLPIRPRAASSWARSIGNARFGYRHIARWSKVSLRWASTSEETGVSEAIARQLVSPAAHARVEAFLVGSYEARRRHECESAFGERAAEFGSGDRVDSPPTVRLQEQAVLQGKIAEFSQAGLQGSNAATVIRRYAGAGGSLTCCGRGVEDRLQGAHSVENYINQQRC
jgi:hypothetical protein